MGGTDKGTIRPAYNAVIGRILNFQVFHLGKLQPTESEILTLAAPRKGTVAAQITTALAVFPLFQVDVRPEPLEKVPGKIDDYLSDNENDHCWWYRLPINEMTGIDKLFSTVFLIWKKKVKDFTDAELLQNCAREDPQYS